MRTVSSIAPVIILGLAGPGGVLLGADWPMYRGPGVEGVSSETAALPWTGGAPKVVWKAPTNLGFSSFAIGGGKAFTAVVREVGGAAREVCLALDAATGKELWTADVDVGKGYSGGGKGDGPRATPAVSEGMVYVFTPNMLLYGLEAENGKVLWQHDLMKEYGGKNIGWKCAASPVVDGNLVFAAGGGSGQTFLAFNKKTGALAWKAGTEALTHSTPALATIHGQRQVIFLVQSGLVALSPEGQALWRFPFKYNTSTAITPVVGGDLVFCSAGYGVGGGVCRIAKTGNGFSAVQVWEKPGNKDVPNHWSTPVAKDGYLYGMFGFRQLMSGPLKCVEMATGKVMWEKPGFGQGNLIVAGGKILALAEDCHLVAIEPSPTAYQEIARTKVLDGKCWSTPAYSDGHVYIRSTDNAACLDLGGK